MIQLKRFKENTSITTVNKFLAKHDNSQIISVDNGITIQYEVKEKLIQPSIELKGYPVEFSFIIYREGFNDPQFLKCNCGHVLFFDNYIIFNCNDVQYKMSLTSKRLENLTYGLNYEGLVYSIDINHYKEIVITEKWDQIGGQHVHTTCEMGEKMRQEGLVNININHLYNERTNAIIESAHIKGKATIKAGESVENGLTKVAMSNIMSAQIGKRALIKATNAKLNNSLMR